MTRKTIKNYKNGLLHSLDDYPVECIEYLDDSNNILHKYRWAVNGDWVMLKLYI